MNNHDTAMAACDELAPSARWAAKSWYNDCLARGFRMVIYEAYRTQEEQNRLFCKGRTVQEFDRLLRYGLITQAQRDTLAAIAAQNFQLASEEVVTWTLKSKHTLGLALDVKPLGCSFADLEGVAREYGITHPLPQDLWHFEFDRCKRQPLSHRIFSLPAQAARLSRAAARTASPLKEALQRQLDRLKRRG